MLTCLSTKWQPSVKAPRLYHIELNGTAQGQNRRDPTETTIAEMADVEPNDIMGERYKMKICVTKIVSTNDWWYMGCRDCWKKLKIEGDTYKCPRCPVFAPLPRFMILLNAVDADIVDKDIRPWLHSPSLALTVKPSLVKRQLWSSPTPGAKPTMFLQNCQVLWTESLPSLSHRTINHSTQITNTIRCRLPSHCMKSLPLNRQRLLRLSINQLALAAHLHRPVHIWQLHHPLSGNDPNIPQAVCFTGNGEKFDCQRRGQTEKPAVRARKAEKRESYERTGISYRRTGHTTARSVKRSRRTST